MFVFEEFKFGVGAVLGALGTLSLYWVRRKFMPLLNVRLDLVQSPDVPEVVRFVLEAENCSEVLLHRKNAELRICEYDFPVPGSQHLDWQPASQKEAEKIHGLIRLNPPVEVMRTLKLEPKEVLHTEVLHRWNSAPVIQCRFSFEYDSWLCRFHLWRPDRHTVLKWFVNPTSLNTSKSE